MEGPLRGYPRRRRRLEMGWRLRFHNIDLHYCVLATRPHSLLTLVRTSAVGVG